MWATSWDCLNDSEEAYVVQRVASRLIEARISSESDTRLKTELNTLLKRTQFHPASHDVCIASWSEAEDDLAQWRAYSGLGTGYALGMKGALLKQLAERSGGLLARCVYDPNEQETIVSEIIQHAIDVVGTGGDFDELYLGDYFVLLRQYSAIFKNSAFESEREWRIISTPNTYDTACFRPGKSTLRTYKPIDLVSVDRPGKSGIDVAEVIVGPCPSDELARHKVFYLMRRHCNADEQTPVSNSKIPFRSW